LPRALLIRAAMGQRTRNLFDPLAISSRV